MCTIHGSHLSLYGFYLDLKSQRFSLYPQEMQKAISSSTGSPQLGHTAGPAGTSGSKEVFSVLSSGSSDKGQPHFTQNLWPAAAAVPHLGQEALSYSE